MVAIAPGVFQMGSPSNEVGRGDDEGPVHLVHISYQLWVSKYPITLAEWKHFVRATGHHDNSDCVKEKQADKEPVICVSWQGAQDYAAWLTRKSGQHYRLLSEAEYEYVTRAGTQTAYFWGSTPTGLSQYSHDNIKKGKTPVGSHEPNFFGLFDLVGNVNSWTQDCYRDSYDGAPTDGSPRDGSKDCSHVIRGGSWADFPRWLRSAARGWADGDGGSSGIIGFRLARD